MDRCDHMTDELRLTPAKNSISLLLAGLRRNFMLVGATTILLWLVVLPTVMLIIFSFRKGHPAVPGEWTLSNYAEAFGDPLLPGALFNTIVIALIGTAITIAIAVLFAWLIERTDMPFRNIAWSLIIIPMAMPGMLFAMSWILLLSPKIGLINVGLRYLLSLVGIAMTEGPMNIFSLGGLIYLESIRGVTTIFLIVVGSFKMMDPELEEAAIIAGASVQTTLRRITLPLMLTAILAGGMYSLISNIESFEAPLVAGLPARIFVLSTLIYFKVHFVGGSNYGLGAVYSILYMGMMLFMVYFYSRVIRQEHKYAVITGKGYRPRVLRLGRWRYLAFSIFIAYFFLSVVLPFIVLVWTSILPFYRVPSLSVLKLLTLKHYLIVFTEPRFGRIVLNTFLLTFFTATLGMIAAVLISWVVVRSRMRGRYLLDGLSFLSYALPGVVMGLAFIILYLQPPLRYIGIYGSIFIVVFALVSHYLAYTTRTMNGALIQIHRELEEAAYLSGSSAWQTLCRIIMPLVAPAFFAGWIWVAAHAMRAFAIPVMLASRENLVASVWLWNYWDQGQIGRAAALGVMLILILTFITVSGRRLIVRAFQ